MRQLSSIQKISKIEEIKGADKIVKATVLGWEVVVSKLEFKEGDSCVYCEVDSLLPEKPEFEFLRERKFRVKTIKLKGQVSQGICFPLSILPLSIKIEEGKDVTDILGIKKYEPYQDEQSVKQSGKIMYPKWIPKFVQRWLHKSKFIRNFFKQNSGQKTFPSCIPKTDETRVQVLQPLLDKYKGIDCYVTEKIDGSSVTVYLINGKFGVCSRNVDLKKDKDDRFWKTVLKYDLENKFKIYFKGQNIALQGELIGEGVQGNKYKLTGNEIYWFNVFYIKQFKYGDYYDLCGILIDLNLEIVPFITDTYHLSNLIPELVEMSKGKSRLNIDTLREGIVIRPISEIEDNTLHCQLVKNRVSFKVINPEFLLKYDQ